MPEADVTSQRQDLSLVRIENHSAGGADVVVSLDIGRPHRWQQPGAYARLILRRRGHKRRRLTVQSAALGLKYAFDLTLQIGVGSRLHSQSASSDAAQPPALLKLPQREPCNVRRLQGIPHSHALYPLVGQRRSLMLLGGDPPQRLPPLQSLLPIAQGGFRRVNGILSGLMGMAVRMALSARSSSEACLPKYTNAAESIP